MAVTITSISPMIGHTGGRSLVTIDGSGFRLPTAQAAASGITPEPPPSVRVSFGGVVAKSVAVASSTLLFVTTAIGDPTNGPVDVVVENIDDSGSPIPGESATLAAAWRYVRPDVTSERSDLVRVIDAFVAELRRQIVPNVMLPKHTDFDPDTSDTLSLIELPEFPCLIIAATSIEDNFFHAEPERQEVDDPDDPDGFLSLDPPDIVDVVFTILGASDNSKELVNLAATVKRFFKKNPRLAMARDANDASKGEVEFELSARDVPRVKIEGRSSENNLRTFAIQARIVAFRIESMVLLDDFGQPLTGSDSLREKGKTVADDDGFVLSIEPKT